MNLSCLLSIQVKLTNKLFSRYYITQGSTREAELVEDMPCHLYNVCVC